MSYEIRIIKILVVVALLFLWIKSCNGATMTVIVTGYSPNDHRQGTGWRTATGRHAVHPGVAVDPRVIPLGSRVKIGEFWYIADDTGRKIKGRRLDWRFTSRSNALRFGKRKMIIEFQTSIMWAKRNADRSLYCKSRQINTLSYFLTTYPQVNYLSLDYSLKEYHPLCISDFHTLMTRSKNTKPKDIMSLSGYSQD